MIILDVISSRLRLVPSWHPFSMILVMYAAAPTSQCRRSGIPSSRWGRGVTKRSLTWCNSEIFLQLHSGVIMLFCTGGMGMVLKLKILITDSRWMSVTVRSSLLKIIHCLSCQTHHWTILSVDADCWANLAKLKSPLKGCIFNFSPFDNDSFKQFYRKRNLNSKLNLNVSCT